VLVVGAALLAAGVATASSPPQARARDLPAAAVEPTRTPVSAVDPAAGAGGAALPVGALAAPAPAVSVGLPGVDDSLPVVAIGVLPSGALQLPADPATVGWWAGGAAPGSDRGSVVLAGHLDSAERGAGPLQALLADDLAGEISVVDSQGTLHRYVVDSRTSYPKAELPPGLFDTDGDPRLVLVTCGGAFDAETGHYEENVVVVARPA
jgi:hypothetical protein